MSPRDKLAQTMREKFAEMLAGVYHCTRVWSAWGVGTMSESDFHPADEGDLPEELAQAALESLAAHEAEKQAVPPNIPGLAADPSAFVRWAEPNGYDMTCHPLHFLFLNEKTYAARDGWNACRAHYRVGEAPPSEKQAGPVAPFGHYFEPSDGSAGVFRKSGQAFPPTALGGSMWALYAAPTAVLAVLDQAKAALQTGLGECDPYSPTCEESQAQMNAAIAAIETMKEAAR